MIEGCAARIRSEPIKVQAKKSIVNFEARVGPVPTLVIGMMVNLMMVMTTMVTTMANTMMTMSMMGTMVATFLRIAAPRLCTVL